MALAMRFNPAPLFLLASLGACTTASDDYPSLALRDAERATGTLQPVAQAYVTPAAAACSEAEKLTPCPGRATRLLAAAPARARG